MVESIIHKNLFLFTNVLNKLNETSVKAFDKKCDFLAIDACYRELQPCIYNLARYCNLQYGESIDTSSEAPQELFALTNHCKHIIRKIDRVISKQKSPVVNFDIYEQKSFDEFGKMLREIDKLPDNQKLINLYFMREMIETAMVVAWYNRKNNGIELVDYLGESGVLERVMSLLEGQEILMDDNREDVVLDVLYDQCQDFVLKAKIAEPKTLNHSIAHALHEAFSVDERDFENLMEEDSETLYKFVKKIKEDARHYQKIFLEMGVFIQSIPKISHQKVEDIIHSAVALPQVHEEEWRSDRPIPGYLQPFIHHPAVAHIIEQMPYWESYQQESQKFNKKDIYALTSLMSISWVKSLCNEFEENRQIIDELLESKEDQEEDDFQKFDAESFSKEVVLLNFAENLLTATRMVEKYINLSLNKTGVDESTIEVMRGKGGLELDDVQVLDELMDDIEQNIIEYKDVIDMAVIPDYVRTFAVIKSMPHGSEKQEALACLNASINVTCSDICEDMQAVLFDVDCQVGHSSSDVDEKFVSLLEESKGHYSDLDVLSTDELASQIHEGVLITYILPMYSNLSFNEDKNDVLVSFIEGFDDLSADTQGYLKNISLYYARQVMKGYIAKELDKENSLRLQQQITAYCECVDFLEKANQIQELVSEKLNEEKKLSAAYHKYQIQKSMFEMPKDMDLFIASAFRRSVREM